MKVFSLNQVHHRPATEGDVPFLLELRRQTMTEHQIASGVVLSDEQHHHRVMAHFEAAEILLSGEVPVGLLKVVREGTEWELLQIQLCPAFQGRGHGAQLVGQIILEAQEAGATLRLGVLKANPARHLYERLGFSVVGEKAHSFEMEWVPNS
jgi:ribosomal protein S18 acetylase RimI-like enzyme